MPSAGRTGGGDPAAHLRPAGLARRGPARRGHRRQPRGAARGAAHPGVERPRRPRRAASAGDLVQTSSTRSPPRRASAPATRRGDPGASPTAISEALGGEVKLYYQPGPAASRTDLVRPPQQPSLVTSLPLPQGPVLGAILTTGAGGGGGDAGRGRGLAGEAVVMAARRWTGSPRRPRSCGAA